MTTELTFLVDLLLNHKLQKSTKDLIAERLKEFASDPGPRPRAIQASVPPELANQSPSTIAAMLRHAEPVEPQPVAVIAQTPAAVAALNSRQQAINEAMSGKANASGGKRKF